MKLKTIFFALAFISATNAFAQNRVVENAIKDVALVPSKDAKMVDNQKPCDIFNKSATRTVTVRIEESSVVNNFLQKKVIVQKIGPKEQKFVGYAGCDGNVLYEKCTGYKINIAYYEEPAAVTTTAQANIPVASATDNKGITSK